VAIRLYNDYRIACPTDRLLLEKGATKALSRDRAKKRQAQQRKQRISRAAYLQRQAKRAKESLMADPRNPAWLAANDLPERVRGVSSPR
jgi:hypothetical protein